MILQKMQSQVKAIFFFQALPEVEKLYQHKHQPVYLMFLLLLLMLLRSLRPDTLERMQRILFKNSFKNVITTLKKLKQEQFTQMKLIRSQENLIILQLQETFQVKAFNKHYLNLQKVQLLRFLLKEVENILSKSFFKWIHQIYYLCVVELSRVLKK